MESEDEGQGEQDVSVPRDTFTSFWTPGLRLRTTIPVFRWPNVFLTFTSSQVGFRRSLRRVVHRVFPIQYIQEFDREKKGG